MPLASLDHITVLCSDVGRSREFYVDVLGMIDGPRPDFDFPGAWLYVGDRAVVHLIGGRNDGIRSTGCFDHVAFDANDIEEMRRRLNKLGLAFREQRAPGFPLRQLFLFDPDGVEIELNFRNAEAG